MAHDEDDKTPRHGAIRHDRTGLRRPDPRREPRDEPVPPMERALLDRVMTHQLEHERQIGALDTKLDDIAATMQTTHSDIRELKTVRVSELRDAQERRDATEKRFNTLEVRVDTVADSAKELGVIRKIAISILGTLALPVIGGVFMIVRSEERQATLEDQATKIEVRTVETDREISKIQTDVRILTRDVERREQDRELIESIAREVRALREQQPTRRRP